MSEEKFELVNPLLTREVRTIANWQEWVRLWHKAQTAHEMEGLLHVGFDLSFVRYSGDEACDELDRLRLYCSVADGWADHYALRCNGDQVGYLLRYEEGLSVKKTARQLRKSLAQKAFDMLCLNFFRSKDIYSHERKIHHGLFPLIQRFFRPEKETDSSEYRIIRNLSYNLKGSRNEQFAVDFLIALINYIWRWKDDVYYPNEHQREIRMHIDSMKPWTIEVLNRLGKLDLLRQWLMTLDKASFSKLKEIALRARLRKGEHPVIEARPVASLKEACYAGSEAALLLSEYKLRKKVDARLHTELSKK